MPQTKRSLVVILALLAPLLPLLGGCAGGVDRTIVVESEPPGALVYLNDQEVGRTPVEVPFLWYGTYDVRLRKEGYEAVKTRRRVWAPLWQIPPFDLLAELVPFPLEDRHRLAFTMEPLPEGVDQAELIQRAERLRGRLESSEYREPETQPTTGERAATRPAQ